MYACKTRATAKHVLHIPVSGHHFFTGAWAVMMFGWTIFLWCVATLSKATEGNDALNNALRQLLRRYTDGDAGSPPGTQQGSYGGPGDVPPLPHSPKFDPSISNNEDNLERTYQELRELLRSRSFGNELEQRSHYESGDKGKGSYSDHQHDYASIAWILEEWTHPSANFFFTEMHKYLGYCPTSTEIKEELELSLSSIRPVMENYQTVFDAMQDDNATIVQYFSKKMTRNFMSERIRCPSAVYDRLFYYAFGKALPTIESKFVMSIRNHLVEYFRNISNHMTLTSENLNPDIMADRLVQEMFKYMFWDTFHFLLKSEFRDLWTFTQMFHWHLNYSMHVFGRDVDRVLTYLEEQTTLQTRLPACQSLREMRNRHRMAVYAIVSRLSVTEPGEICNGIQSTLMSWFDQKENFDLDHPNLEFVCEEVASYFEHMINYFSGYDEAFTSGNHTVLARFFGSLSPEQKELLNTVLETLERTDGGPRNDRNFELLEKDRIFWTE